MRFVVINLKKHPVSASVMKLIVVLVLTVAVSVSVVTRIMRDDLLAYASTGISPEQIIVIDAGHGGEDSGAVGAGGVLEKDLNLDIAFEVGRQLEEKGYIIIYTRTDDRLLYTEEENIKGLRKISDLKNRCKVAEKYPDSVFVSIHMNSFGDARYSGLQVYYSKNDESSAALAGYIQSTVCSQIQTDNNRVTKPGDGMYLLENVKNPAVLIECGFLTNEEECLKLSEKEYQKSLSFSIVCGIIEYMEAMQR